MLHFFILNLTKRFLKFTFAASICCFNWLSLCVWLCSRNVLLATVLYLRAKTSCCANNARAVATAIFIFQLLWQISLFFLFENLPLTWVNEHILWGMQFFCHNNHYIIIGLCETLGKVRLTFLPLPLAQTKAMLGRRDHGNLLKLADW